MMQRFKVEFFLFLAFMGAVTPMAASQPQLVFKNGLVIASQVTPGGCGVFLGVSKEAADWTEVTLPGLAPVVDDNGDGILNYSPGGITTNKAVWAVVDATSGDYTVNTPIPAALVTVDPATLSGNRIQLVDARQSLELLVVRPGVGAWHSRNFDGTASDDDGVDDGQITVPLRDVLTQVWPLGSTVAYKGAAPGDVLVGIDPTRLEFWSLVVTP
ncbi:MAG: hypothetical protein K0U98_01120 [Deltaproteobacteria bacterium]|nr:hypothetical protein [Deltaproteobacteria bacterium]